jgi:hypothetical protein
MLVLGIIALLLGVVGLLLTPIHFPMLDEALFTYVDTLVGYIGGNAANVVNFLLPGGIVATLMDVLIFTIAAYYAYLIIMWVLRKFPAGPQ